MKAFNIKENIDKIIAVSIGDNVEINKGMSRIMREAKNQAKPHCCLICEKEQTSFCNSHTVPAFCLRNIQKNGKVFTCNSIVKYPFYLKKESGINDAGTFRLICRECDNNVFQDYENPSAYDTEPNTKILAQIALKNSLKAISKRMNGIQMYEVLKKYTVGKERLLDAFSSVENKDFDGYYSSIQKAKSVLKKESNDGYFLLFYKTLNYVTPIAYQGQVTLYVDFDGNIINDMYYDNPKYKTKDLHICIFPLEYKTVIMLFIENNETRYRSFYKKFKKLSDEDKLSVINYIVFLYSEDYFLSEDIKKIIDSDESLSKIIGQTNLISLTVDDIKQKNIFSSIKNLYALNKHSQVTNILSEKYQFNRGL